MKNIDFYIEQAKKRESFDERGTGKFCFLFDDCALLYAPQWILKEIEDQKPHVKKLADEGHKTPRILEIKLEDDDYFEILHAPESAYGFVLEERAEGEPIHNKYTRSFSCNVNTNQTTQEMYEKYLHVIGRYAARMQEIANLSQDQINQYVDTIIKLMISPTTILGYDNIGDNCLFDPQEGISFIDLGYKQDNENEKVNYVKHKSWNILKRLFDHPPEKSFFRITRDIGRPLKLSELGKYGANLDLGFPLEWMESIFESYQTILDKTIPPLLANGVKQEEVEMFVNGYPIAGVPGAVGGGLKQRLEEWERQIKPAEQIKDEIAVARTKLLEIPLESEKTI